MASPRRDELRAVAVLDLASCGERMGFGFGAEMTALKNQIVSVTNLNHSVRVGFALGFV